jgi:putative heme-binding domain-containing protein
MKQKAFLSLFVLFLAGAVVDAGSWQDPISALSADDLAQGKRLYVGHCAPCHGIEGSGGRGPHLNQPKLRRATSDVLLFGIIKNGVLNTEMPGAWQMTDREIWRVAGYVRSLSRAAVVNLPGNPEKGKTIYDSYGCATCHIVRGEGGNSGPELTEIGARRSPSYLLEALIDPGASAPDGFLVVSVTTRDGRTVRGTRINEDSFTIQLRDLNNQFRSFRKSDLKDLKKEFGASTMPSYKNGLTAAELDDLVAYLAGLRGEQ